MPKLTIITACYNSEATLQDTINSVLGQIFIDFEYLLIDGKSKDSTLEIIKKNAELDTRINYISESDKGIYDAMNKGVSLAKGEYIGILNSDDVYFDNTVLDNVVSKLDSTKANTLYADLQYVTEDLKKVTRNWVSGIFQSNSFKWGWMPPHPTFFVKSDLYKKYGSFNLQLKSAADYELMLRFLHKNKVSTCYLPKTIVKMREGGISNASLFNRLKANNEDRLAWKINNIKPYWFTLTLKPIRKIGQFL